MASISVPIEKNRSYNHSGGYGSNVFNNSRGVQSTFLDNGPPYIVKIMNIPVNSDLGFLDDLFKSRFTKYIKGRIVVDPNPDPLRTGIIKKIAFVELNSFADQSRVLKWQDLVYRGTRRMVVELADFNDFQNCMSFNQNHERELQEVEKKSSFGRHEHSDGFPPRHRPDGRTGGGMPLDSIPTATPRYQLHTRRLSQETQPKLVPPPTTKPAPHPKPNPFGQAKPVDIVAHQLENEKKMIVINNTTIKTVGSIPEVSEQEKLHTKAPLGEKSVEDAKPAEEVFLTSNHSGLTKKFTAAPIPESIYGQKQSLAHFLSNTSDGSGVSSGSRPGRSPPQAAMKTTILKKKHQDPISSIEVRVEPKEPKPTEEVAEGKKYKSQDPLNGKLTATKPLRESGSNDSVEVSNEDAVINHKKVSPGNFKKNDKANGKSKNRDRRQLIDERKSGASKSTSEDFQTEEKKKNHDQECPVETSPEKAMGNNSQYSKQRRRQSGAGPEESNSGANSSRSKKFSSKGADRPRRASNVDEDKVSTRKNSELFKPKASKQIDGKCSNDSERKVEASYGEDEDRFKPSKQGVTSSRRASHFKVKSTSVSSKEKSDVKSKVQKPESKVPKSQTPPDSIDAAGERGEQDAELPVQFESTRGRGRGRGRGRRNSAGRGSRRGRGGHQRSGIDGQQNSKSDAAAHNMADV